ncbi:NAD(P)/FAD-dependent oxidoreductase [Puniceibacterium sp. IMCC21224]|uniref:NAD(P)/FAD-dependent oxidoreductase n=1 Tax=Puniceibacterium sp. IMCC21224 TaxID=1618204 RepID=UPI0012E0942F|nr:FAD-dependent oxidoreductase [Puniceibacterium sp. IMCC21224]
MPSKLRIVIVGAGHAGCQLAFSLRNNGHAGEIVLINGEAEQPYQRPPLSKGFLKSGHRAALFFREDNAFAQQGITMVTERAAFIDRVRQNVSLHSGAQLAYDHLVLATGTFTRRLSSPDGDVRYLKSIEDAETLRAMLPSANRLCVIGAGFIGLEFAAFAAEHGKVVDVVDMAPALMSRAASAQVSSFFLRRHQEAGVRFHLGAEIVNMIKVGNHTQIRLASGAELKADIVVAGIGVLPDTALAESAGLDTANGVVVDQYLSTSDPAISAVGDCANFPTPYFPTPIRLESVQNANDHARTLALRLTGQPEPYTALPWFWSDQGNDKLQIAGLTGKADLQVLRGAPDQNRFSLFSFRNDTLFAVESVNQPAEHMVARRLISGHVAVCPDRIGDQTRDIKSFLTPAASGVRHAAV